MKRRPQRKRKRTTRRRRKLVAKVTMSDEPVDLEAFARSYVQAIIREVEKERHPT